jgi:hypothetical protein
MFGCGSGYLNSPQTEHAGTVSTEANPNAIYITASAVPSLLVLDSTSLLSWNVTGGATDVILVGSDLVEEDSSGQVVISPSSSVEYTIFANFNGTVASKSISVSVQIPDNVLNESREQWLAQVDSEAASMNCSGPLLYQQGEETIDALAKRAIATGSSCVVLRPTSGQLADHYYVGSVDASPASTILYFSDVDTSQL